MIGFAVAEKQMGGVSATPGATKAAKQEKSEEEEDESEEEDSEEEYDDEGDEHSLSVASSGLLWGSIAVGAVAVSVAALLALGKRR